MKLTSEFALLSLLDFQCFQNNLDYYGNDVSSISASSPNDCQEKCQNNKDCGVWTYGKEKNIRGENCWLKNDNSYKVWKKDLISGPKYCGE